jgi:hypothetical protein
VAVWTQIWAVRRPKYWEVRLTLQGGPSYSATGDTLAEALGEVRRQRAEEA